MRLRDLFAIAILLSALPAAKAEFCAINITSNPPGAAVLINGKAAGKTPLVHQTGHPARLRVKIVKQGFHVWEKQIEIGMSQIVGLDVELVAKKRP